MFGLITLAKLYGVSVEDILSRVKDGYKERYGKISGHNSNTDALDKVNFLIEQFVSTFF